VHQVTLCNLAQTANLRSICDRLCGAYQPCILLYIYWVYICIYILVRIQVVPRYIVYVYPWILYHNVYIVSVLVVRYTCMCISNYPGIRSVCMSLVIVSYVI
jgi:hypothetical protein